MGEQLFNIFVTFYKKTDRMSGITDAHFTNVPTAESGASQMGSELSVSARVHTKVISGRHIVTPH